MNSPCRIRFARHPSAAGLISIVLLGAACNRPAASGDAARPASAAAPSDSALMAKGLELEEAGGAADAVASFKTILERNPTHYGAHYQLARALDLAGRPVEARAEWENVLPMAEQYNDTANLNRVRARLAQPDTLSQEQRMARGLYSLYRQGDPASAVTEFRQLLEQNPTHYGAHYQIAKALDQAGQSVEARKWWTKMLAMAEAINDQITADTARARIRRTP